MKIKDITQEKEEFNPEKDLDYMVVSSQKNIKEKIDPEKTFLLLPNFVRYARFLSSGKYKECFDDFLRNMNLRKNIGLNIRNSFSLTPLSGFFWSAVIEMCLVDISSVNKKSNVIINPFIVDLAFYSGKQKVIKKIVSIAKKSVKGKVGIWTRNINLILPKTNLGDLGIDFIVTPYNKFRVGEKIRRDILSKRLEEEKILLIKDYVSHFQSFSDEIEIDENALFK